LKGAVELAQRTGEDALGAPLADPEPRRDVGVVQAQPSAEDKHLAFERGQAGGGLLDLLAFAGKSRMGRFAAHHIGARDDR
jgi:hypothetical protein